MDQLETEEIYKWIDSYQLSRQKKNISRDFSDAVSLAEILKYHFPKLVDLHNYTPKNAVAQKLINWDTLHRKVLSKIKIHLSKNTLEELARAECGTIEKVLSEVKLTIDKINSKCKEEEDNVYMVEGLSDDTNRAIFPIKMKLGSKITERKIVPAEIFDDMIKQIDEKDIIIEKLNLKVDHLKKMVTLKDERIDDLVAEIKKLSMELDSAPPTERFLNNLF